MSAELRAWYIASPLLRPVSSFFPKALREGASGAKHFYCNGWVHFCDDHGLSPTTALELRGSAVLSVA